MKGLPQIRLRTIFAIFFCAAVGLTVGTSPDPSREAWTQFFSSYAANLNWQAALFSAGSVAIAIGLLQQMRDLWMHLSSANATAAFAKRFAIGWRLSALGLIVVCLAAKLLVVRGVIALPKSEMLSVYDLFPDILWMSVIVIALASNLARWRPHRTQPKPRRFFRMIIWLSAAALGVVLYASLTEVSYLAHIASAGTHWATPPEFQRPNVYPNHRYEGFSTFWSSFGAVLCIAVTGIALVASQRAQPSERTLRLRWTICFSGFLLIAAGYCCWYYTQEFARISPDLAEAGPASNWLEWFSGVAMAAMMITAGAHRLSSARVSEPVAPISFSNQGRSVYFSDSFLCFAMLAGSVVIYFVEMTRMYVDFASQPLFGNFWTHAFTYFATDLRSYLKLGILTWSLQLCWLRWRRRKEVVPWTLVAIDGKRFAWNWLALALIALVGIPTLSAFSFVFWLGPWWLVGP